MGASLIQAWTATNLSNSSWGRARCVFLFDMPPFAAFRLHEDLFSRAPYCAWTGYQGLGQWPLEHV
jgi:hypothetical protein